MEPSLPPLLAKGNSAYGSGYFFLPHSVSFSIPYPLTARTIAIAYLKHVFAASAPTPVLKPQKEVGHRHNRNGVLHALGPFLQAGDEICREDLQS